MNDKNMLYFMTVAEEKSISRAAEKLFVAQPSLTQAIQRIEKGFGVTLFRRTSRGLVLTDEGRKLYLTINQVNSLWNDFKTGITGENDQKTGRIIIDTPSHLGALIVPPVVDLFKKRYPGVDCVVEEYVFIEAEERLLRGQADIIVAVRPELGASEKLNYEFLFRDNYVLVISEQLQQTIRDFRYTESGKGRYIDLRCIKDCTFFAPMKGKRSSGIVNRVFENAGMVNQKIADCAINQLLVEKMVAQGLGCAIMPETYIIPDPRIRKYYLPPSCSPYWDICLATLKGSPRTQLQQEWINIAHELFDNNVPLF